MFPRARRAATGRRKTITSRQRIIKVIRLGGAAPASRQRVARDTKRYIAKRRSAGVKTTRLGLQKAPSLIAAQIRRGAPRKHRAGAKTLLLFACRDARGPRRGAHSKRQASDRLI